MDGVAVTKSNVQYEQAGPVYNKHTDNKTNISTKHKHVPKNGRLSGHHLRWHVFGRQIQRTGGNHMHTQLAAHVATQQRGDGRTGGGNVGTLG